MQRDSRLCRYTYSAIFVGVLMTSRWILPIGDDTYLLLSIPLGLLFQHILVHRPMSQIWVRDADAFRFGWVALTLAGTFCLLSVWVVYRVSQRDHPAFFSLAAPSFLGACIAGFVVSRQDSAKFASGLPAFGLALVGGLGFFAATAVQRGASSTFSLHCLPDALTDFWLMFSGMFVVEEVIFRGLLDAYVARPSDGVIAKWISAAFVSVLWGVWHLPFEHFNSTTALISALQGHFFVEIPLGIALSFCVRRSGTLLLPVVAHAAIDAYRNALLR